MGGDSIVVLFFGFVIGWALVWFAIVRPICARLDKIIKRLANLDVKTPGKPMYVISSQADELLGIK
jgi:hypothetical protein